jgi:hypothetical protein
LTLDLTKSPPHPCPALARSTASSNRSGIGDWSSAAWARRQALSGAAALLESGDDRLGGPHALGELALAEAGLGAQVVDELTEREVVFDPGLTAALLA